MGVGLTGQRITNIPPPDDETDPPLRFSQFHNTMQEDTMALDTEVTTVADPNVIDPDTLEPAINTIITESKAGYKTTEFWVTIVVSLFAVVDPASLPDWAQTALLGVAAAAYAVSRGLAKAGIPHVDVPSA